MCSWSVPVATYNASLHHSWYVCQCCWRCSTRPECPLHIFGFGVPPSNVKLHQGFLPDLWIRRTKSLNRFSHVEGPPVFNSFSTYLSLGIALPLALPVYLLGDPTLTSTGGCEGCCAIFKVTLSVKIRGCLCSRLYLLPSVVWIRQRLSQGVSSLNCCPACIIFGSIMIIILIINPAASFSNSVRTDC